MPKPLKVGAIVCAAIVIIDALLWLFSEGEGTDSLILMLVSGLINLPALPFVVLLGPLVVPMGEAEIMPGERNLAIFAVVFSSLVWGFLAGCLFGGKSKNRTPLIAIKTTRYSVFFEFLLEHYRKDSKIVIDGMDYTYSDVDWLIANWCVNARIKKTRNFVLIQDEREICGFHDDPDETWLIAEEELFARELEKRAIIRYRVLPGVK